MLVVFCGEQMEAFCAYLSKENVKIVFIGNLKIYGRLCSNFYRVTCILFELETPSWQNGNSASF